MSASTDPDRRCGIEIEFTGIDIAGAVRAVTDALGGEVVWKGNHVAKIQDTPIGGIGIELDTRYAKEPDDPDLVDEILDVLGTRDDAAEFLSEIMPIPLEMVTDPIARRDLPVLQTAIDALRQAGATGTKGGTLHAFGMHLNPEFKGDPETAIRIAACYAFAERWLRARMEPDNARRVTPFIDPLPRRYVATLTERFAHRGMTLEDFIPLYARHNPDRNRGLDMWPLLGHLDKDLAQAHHDGPIKGIRPAFHYRLPDSLMGDVGWGPQADLDRWETLESVAADPTRFEELRVAAERHTAGQTTAGAYLTAVDKVLG